MSFVSAVKRITIKVIGEASLLTKIIFVIGLKLIAWGIMCRLSNIYVFWESLWIGSFFVCASVILLCIDRLKIKARLKKNSTLEKIGIGSISFIFLIQIILLIFTPSSNAYEASKIYLENNEALINEVGNINSYSIIPLGSLSISKNEGSTSGQALIYLTVKGDKKYRDITLYVAKYADKNEWQVIEME